MKYIKLSALFILFLPLVTCSSDSQFTKMLTANPFIAELYGETTKTIEIDMGDSEHIAWMGLEWAADYKFFSIEQITAGGVVTVPENSGSTVIFENVSLVPTESSGILGSSSSGEGLQVKITYSPLAALEAEDDPHTAYLLIVTDDGKTGTIRVELNGFVKGIAGGKCNASGDALTAHRYKLKSGTIKLSICDVNGVPDGQVTPGAPGEQTNQEDIPIDGDFVFYQADDETVCIFGAEGSTDPTIPAFDLPIPEGISPVTDDIGFLPVQLPDGFKTECELNGGSLLCDANIQLEVYGGAVPVSPITVTNGTIDPVSPDCSMFGSVTGEGNFGGSSLTVVGFGEVGSDATTEAFEIDGALVVVEIELEK